MFQELARKSLLDPCQMQKQVTIYSPIFKLTLTIPFLFLALIIYVIFFAFVFFGTYNVEVF